MGVVYFDYCLVRDFVVGGFEDFEFLFQFSFEVDEVRYLVIRVFNAFFKVADKAVEGFEFILVFDLAVDEVSGRGNCSMEALGFCSGFGGLFDRV